MSELWLIVLGMSFGYGLLGLFVLVFSYVLKESLEKVRDVSLLLSIGFITFFLTGLLIRTAGPTTNYSTKEKPAIEVQEKIEEE